MGTTSHLVPLAFPPCAVSIRRSYSPLGAGVGPPLSPPSLTGKRPGTGPARACDWVLFTADLGTNGVHVLCKAGQITSHDGL